MWNFVVDFFSDLIFFLERTIRALAKINYFVQLVRNWVSMNDRKTVQSDISERPNVTKMWQLLIDYDRFLSDCPTLMHGIAIPNVQHYQATLEHWVCELAHSFFLFFSFFFWWIGKKQPDSIIQFIDKGLHMLKIHFHNFHVLRCFIKKKKLEKY